MRKVDPAGYFLLTTQAVSSWGGCSLFASADKQKQFFALNSDSLKLESAMGEGEYLTAYANLLGCSPKGTQALKTGLKTNYAQIWGQDSTKSPEEAYQAINSLIRSDSTLSKECAINS